jgi:pyruvate carboxylase
VRVRDTALKVDLVKNQKVDKISTGDVGAPLQGRLTKIMVNPGDVVVKNQPLFVIEAMKMESIVSAPVAGLVQRVLLKAGTVIEQDDWVLVIG